MAKRGTSPAGGRFSHLHVEHLGPGYYRAGGYLLVLESLDDEHARWSVLDNEDGCYAEGLETLRDALYFVAGMAAGSGHG